MSRSIALPGIVRTPTAALVVLAALVADGIGGPLRAQAAVRSGHTLVVLLTIDQLRPDYFARFGDQLTGGLARIARGGAVMSNAFQDHANTETAPGHATLLSGRYPRSTGIVINELGVPDPSHPLIGGGGAGASPSRFRGTTLFDWLKASDPGSRALSISKKDRGAILPVGLAREAVVWYALNGRFTTSTYYADTLPTWLEAFNARRLPHLHAGRSWDLLLPASAYPEPDSVPVENSGRNFMFPHTISADTNTAVRTIVDFPWLDEITLAAALAGVEAMQLGAGGSTDLLAVSLSSTDAVGHRYGPDSRELRDQVLRLDRYLGEFLDSLYRMRDSSGIILVLSADHGVTRYPELQSAASGPGPRWVSVAPVMTRFRSALTPRGVPSAAFAMEDAMLRLDREVFQSAGVDADSVVREFAEAVRALPGVARVDMVRDLAAVDTVADPIGRRWYRAIPPDFPVELVITLDVGSAWGRPGSQAAHGSPHDSDAHVPLIFYGRAFAAGRYSGKASVVDIAPTLARVLRVAPAEALDGRILTEILRQ